MIPRPWYRSRLFWLGLPGLICVLWMWFFPFLLGESKYFGGRWITPGNRYQGFGVTLDFHQIALWAGRPYAGLFNVMRRTGTTYQSDPFESQRDSWGANKRGPIGFIRGRPSSDSFTATIDYWFVAPAYLSVWTVALILWQRRKWWIFRRCPISPIQIQSEQFVDDNPS